MPTSTYITKHQQYKHVLSSTIHVCIHLVDIPSFANTTIHYQYTCLQIQRYITNKHVLLTYQVLQIQPDVDNVCIVVFAHLQQYKHPDVDNTYQVM